MHAVTNYNGDCIFPRMWNSSIFELISMCANVYAGPHYVQISPDVQRKINSDVWGSPRAGGLKGKGFRPEFYERRRKLHVVWTSPGFLPGLSKSLGRVSDLWVSAIPGMSISLSPLAFSELRSPKRFLKSLCGSLPPPCLSVCLSSSLSRLPPKRSHGNIVGISGKATFSGR